MKTPPFLYIAGPYRGGEKNGDHMSNCHRAMEVWDYCWKNRVFAICPHWSFGQQLALPIPDVDWLAYTMGQMMLCKAVYRMEGVSYGSDAEVAAAKQRGIPVFYDIRKAVEYMRADYGASTCGEGDCGDCCEVGCNPEQKSQIHTQNRHNEQACVWRLADCSGRGHTFGLHDSIAGPGVSG